ncbi:MAG: hypothetical protein PGN25_06340 [Methylorubrum populi]
MKLDNFEEWFAIRANHSDDDHWPGRLSFDLENGIYLTTARFAGDADSFGDPTFHARTMTGWLDYQRPTTLIHPWIQTVGGFTASVDAPAMRASYRFVVNAVLKNVFLEDIDERMFTGLVVEHPAINAWINPRLVDHDWSRSENAGLPSLSVAVEPPRQRTFRLQDGTEAVVTSATRAPQGEAMTLHEYTVLRLRFPEPVDYEAITRLTWRISVLFEFMIGARTEAPVYQLPTTRTRMWNDEPREVVAEFWYLPARKGRNKSVSPRASQRLTVEGRSAISLEALLNRVVGGSDELIYLANVIQSVEDQELSLTQGYGELIGCLEDFDGRQFGSGADPDFRDSMQSLARVVQQHGSEADRALFERLRGGARNSYSLLKRLERLHQFWSDDDFRGNPNLRRIRDIRNLLPHGQGLQLSSNVAHEMVTYLSYLTALGRYHVLRALGCTGDEIAAAFSWQAHRYGMFVPERTFRAGP